MTMAYSDYGAFVYLDGQRREDREDVGVFNDQEKDVPSGGRIFANLARNMDAYPEGATPWWEHSHHAVLGDGRVRLTGYKSRPELWHDDDAGVARVDLQEFATGWDDDGYPDRWAGVYLGHRFTAGTVSVGRRDLLRLTLVTPDGERWFARCGYLYGAGHMETDPDGPEEVR